MKRYHVAVVIEKDKSGYFAYVPELQGCYTQGVTYEEVMDNIKDAIRLHIEDRIATNQPLPTADMVSLSTLEVAV
jgi:predicted RNase H-like HicB family nuclease